MKNFKILFCLLLFIIFSGNVMADWSSEESDEYLEEENEITWPIPYTDAAPNIDKLVENHIEVKEQNNSKESQTGWTGGPDYTPPNGNKPVVENIIPPEDTAMPLANKDLVVDDGVMSLSASMPPEYPLIQKEEYEEVKEIVQETNDNKILQDTVRDWIAKEGMTLREVLTQWASIEGWEVVWNTKREYPLKASAIFRGRFKDVASAVIRNFSKATPQPLAKFYLGNRVLVVKTLEENDAN